MNESGTGLVGTEQWVVCEIAGCTHRIAYRGVGRRPKYCGHVVGGVPHTRLTAYRLARNELTLPRPGGVAEMMTESHAEEGYADQSRPVSMARMTLEGLLGEVRELVRGHECRMAALVEQVSTAVTTVADPDAAAAEVAAAHREARTSIDAAEAERDDAVTRARAAERTAQAAGQARQAAEEIAEKALADLEEAHEQRDQAIRERDDLVAEADRVNQEWQRAAGWLAEERAHTGEQRRRVEAAEQQVSRAAGRIEYLSSELAMARGQVEHWQVQAGEHRAELAGVRSELIAAHAALEAEHNYGAQRLADQQARYEDLITELRTQLRDRPQQQSRARRRVETETR
jgi:chromosome segregation ATPase